MRTDPPRGLTDNLSDPDARIVLADWYEAHGLPVTLTWLNADVAADVDDYLRTNEVDEVVVDDGFISTEFADHGVDEGVENDADNANTALEDKAPDNGDIDRAGAAAAPADKTQLQEPLMEPGLYLLRLRGGWYGRGLTYIGWLAPYRGDWWHLMAARPLRRRDNNMTTLGRLALIGPTPSHYTAETEGTSTVHVMIDLIQRFPADPRLWEDLCPKPADWKY